MRTADSAPPEDDGADSAPRESRHHNRGRSHDDDRQDDKGRDARQERRVKSEHVTAGSALATALAVVLGLPIGGTILTSRSETRADAQSGRLEAKLDEGNKIVMELRNEVKLQGREIGDLRLAFAEIKGERAAETALTKQMLAEHERRLRAIEEKK